MDLFRGFAATMVLLHHAVGLDWRKVYPVQPFHQIVQTVFGFGLQFVMVFFVLSGFVIASSVVPKIFLGKWSWRDYFISRLTRLWLVLIPALFLTYFVEKFAYPYTHVGEVGIPL